MTTLLLVRHGHTDAAGRRLTGHQRGVHLNARGRREAEGLVDRLHGVPVDAIWTSPLERCRETAAPLARARGLSVTADRGLIETDYGDWSGRTLAQLRRTRLWRNVIAMPSTFRFPGGESFPEVLARVVDAAARSALANPGGTVALVSHADPIRVLVTHLAGAHLDHVQRLMVEPASISAVALGDGLPRVLKVNDTGDLASLGPAPKARSRKVGG